MAGHCQARIKAALRICLIEIHEAGLARLFYGTILLAMSRTRANQPAIRKGSKAATEASSRGEIDAFLSQAKASLDTGRASGRLVLALDATMSRQPSWDFASGIQAEMFRAAGRTGKLSMQLVYFRGFDECRASKWANDGKQLADMMSRIDCRAGHTQIGKVLKHAMREHETKAISAVIYIGDAMEESADDLGDLAGRLGMRNVPVFLFQEGRDSLVEMTFKEIARLTRGGWFRFDRSSPEVVSRLLESIAVYATGGLKALEARGSREDRLLIEKLSGR